MYKKMLEKNRLYFAGVCFNSDCGLVRSHGLSCAYQQLGGTRNYVIRGSPARDPRGLWWKHTLRGRNSTMSSLKGFINRALAYKRKCGGCC